MHALKMIGIVATLAIGGAASVVPKADAITYSQCLATLMREGYTNYGRVPLGIRIKAAYIVCEQFGV